MVPRLKEHDLGGGYVRNCFYRHRTRCGSTGSVFATEESLPHEYKRSSQIEGMACWIKEPAEDTHVGLLATDVSEIDPVSVVRIKRLVGEIEPKWIQAVRDACQHTNRLEEIAWESGVHELNAVEAITCLLREAGEIPPIEVEGHGEE